MPIFQTKFMLCLSAAVTISMTAAVVAADSATGNNLNSRTSSGGSIGGSSGGSVSGSSSGSVSGGSSGSSNRSISFSENGKQFSIKEDNSGITVTSTETIDGKEKKTEVKAASAKELNSKSPEAYRLYERHLGSNTGAGRTGGRSGASGRSGGNASRSGRVSASSSGGAAGGGGGRSTAFIMDGKKVSITESTDSGITVTITESVDGKEKTTVAKAANSRELEKRSPEAYRMYKSRMDNAGGADAVQMLREQLRNQIKENAGNPQMKTMLEQMLRDLDK